MNESQRMTITEPFSVDSKKTRTIRVSGQAPQTPGQYHHFVELEGQNDMILENGQLRPRRKLLRIVLTVGPPDESKTTQKQPDIEGTFTPSKCPPDLLASMSTLNEMALAASIIAFSVLMTTTKNPQVAPLIQTLRLLQPDAIATALGGFLRELHLGNDEVKVMEQHFSVDPATVDNWQLFTSRALEYAGSLVPDNRRMMVACSVLFASPSPEAPLCVAGLLENVMFPLGKGTKPVDFLERACARGPVGPGLITGTITWCKEVLHLRSTAVLANDGFFSLLEEMNSLSSASILQALARHVAFNNSKLTQVLEAKSRDDAAWGWVVSQLAVSTVPNLVKPVITLLTAPANQLLFEMLLIMEARFTSGPAKTCLRRFSSALHRLLGAKSNDRTLSRDQVALAPFCFVRQEATLDALRAIYANAQNTPEQRRAMTGNMTSVLRFLSPDLAE
jgi:hypothetical protein